MYTGLPLIPAMTPVNSMASPVSFARITDCLGPSRFSKTPSTSNPNSVTESSARTV